MDYKVVSKILHKVGLQVVHECILHEQVIFSTILFHFYHATLCQHSIYAVVLCLSVCSTVCHSQYCIKTTGRIKLAFCMETSFHLSHFDTSENKGTSLWNYVPNSGLRKFHHGKSPASSTKLVVDSWACWQHLYDNRWLVAVCYKLINLLTQLLRFVMDLLYNLFLRLTKFWLI